MNGRGSSILHLLWFTCYLMRSQSLLVVALLQDPENGALRKSSPGVRTMRTTIEVEEKFSLVDRSLPELQSRLKELGFSESKRTTEMVDWYYDTEGCDLTRQDCWLRYREDSKKGSGRWQLKMGRKGHLTSGSSTVYDEIEDEAAVKTCCDLLPSTPGNAASEPDYPYDGCSVPDFPVQGTGLVAIARIYTRRTKWTQTQPSCQVRLTVDLDATDFDYGVGEVEAVVDNDDDIENARRSIKDLIEALTGGSNNIPASGKLEFYLEKYRPRIFEILVDCGVIRKR